MKLFTVAGASFANSSSLMSPMCILIVAKYFLLVSIIIAGAQSYFLDRLPPTTGVAIGAAAHGVCVFEVLFPSPHATSTHAIAAMPKIVHLVMDPRTSAAP